MQTWESKCQPHRTCSLYAPDAVDSLTSMNAVRLTLTGERPFNAIIRADFRLRLSGNAVSDTRQVRASYAATLEPMLTSGTGPSHDTALCTQESWAK